MARGLLELPPGTPEAAALVQALHFLAAVALAHDILDALALQHALAPPRTRTNTLPMAVETREERRRLSPKTSAFVRCVV